MLAKSSNDTGQTCQITETSRTSPLKLWPTPRAGNPGSRRPGTGGKVLAEEVKKPDELPEVFTSLQGDFLVSLSALPGSSEARKMTATSGRKCAELLRSQDRLGCLVRTCLESSTWNSTACFLTWKILATPAGRLLFRLSPSMPDTDETDYGLWPTPGAAKANNDTNLTCSGDGRTKPNKLGWAVALWPTPTKQDGENNAGPSQWERNTPPLNVAVKMYPTMDVGAAKGRGQASADNRSRLGGSLNPEWVEWLMGYPIGHTDLKDSETPSSPKLPKPCCE